MSWRIDSFPLARCRRGPGSHRLASGRGRAVLVCALWAFCSIGFAPGARAEASPYLIGPGDVLQIAFYAGGEKEEDFTARVSPSGTITSLLIGEFSVQGLSTEEVARRLRELLARDFLVNPQVLVSVKEYRGEVIVLGEVAHPGTYPMNEALTILRACLLAGGFTSFAAPQRAELTRTVQGQPRVTVVDLVRVRQGKKDDLPLQRGDRIQIPHRRF